MQQRGFTLLELLLAIAIFAMISLSGFTIFQTVSGSEQSGREKLNALNALQTTFLVIERDITQIARRHVRAGSLNNKGAFIYTDTDALSTAATGLGFVRAGWTNPQLMLARSELQSVGYRLVDESLERIHFNFVDPIAGEEPKVRVLLSGVKALSFEFFYQNQWQKELKTTSEALPKAIAIEIDSEAFGLVRRQFLVAGAKVIDTEDS